MIKIFKDLRSRLFDDRPISRRNISQTTTTYCPNCKKDSPVLYLGNYGVQWKPAHLYSCLNCGERINSQNELAGARA